MTQSEQSVIDRDRSRRSARWSRVRIGAPVDTRRGRRARRAERAAGQIARLERELSAIVAERFPHISPPRHPEVGARRRWPVACSTLAELERSRDRLAGRVQELRRLAASAPSTSARHELLERMKLEPGRYRFARLPVSDLGRAAAACGRCARGSA